MVFCNIVQRPTSIDQNEILHHFKHPIHVTLCVWVIDDFLFQTPIKDINKLLIDFHQRNHIGFEQKHNHHTSCSLIIHIVLFRFIFEIMVHWV